MSLYSIGNNVYPARQEAPGASGFSIIAVNGGLVMLDDTLAVLLDTGFDPPVGTTYDFLTFNPGMLNGTFSSIVSRPFNNDTEYWVVQYDNAGGFVALEAQPIPEPSSLLLLGSGVMLGVGVLRPRLTR